MKLLKYTQGSPEWLAMRRNCIGASDAPIIMGVSPYRTREQLMHDKVYGTSIKMSASMSYGKQMEPELLRCCELWTSGTPMFPGKVYAHDLREWMIASIDVSNIDVTQIFETKCANKVDHAIAVSGEIPPKYYPQLQHQIAVTGLDGSYYFSYHQGEGKLNWCPKNEEYIEVMLQKELEFYQEMIEMKRKHIESIENDEAVGW